MIRGVSDCGIIDCFEVLKYCSTVVSSHTATHVPMIPKWDSVVLQSVPRAAAGPCSGRCDLADVTSSLHYHLWPGGMDTFRGYVLLLVLQHTADPRNDCGWW